jgi:hypothetical protein
MDQVGASREKSQDSQQLLPVVFGLPFVESDKSIGEETGKEEAVEELAMVRIGCRFNKIRQGAEAVPSHATGGGVLEPVFLLRAQGCRCSSEGQSGYESMFCCVHCCSPVSGIYRW